MMTEIPIPQGTFFWTNLRACNTNKALWGEDAFEWKPERWLKPLPQALEDAHIPGIYSHLMTFISGGHACIGFKFSQLEMIRAFREADHLEVLWHHVPRGERREREARDVPQGVSGVTADLQLL
ncbi:hypothetical protein C8Q80DRAFT_318504 [Daedaleopsis nitida]|nr:hypothetical protein C8Q80DRAFT_318504 [Daedaleopsis nitida]